MHYTELDYPLYFWRSRHGLEVDILFETANGYIAIELKNGSRWEKKFNRGMHRLSEELGKDKVKCFGVYTGEKQLLLDGVMVYPALDFLKLLWGNELVSGQNTIQPRA